MSASPILPDTAFRYEHADVPEGVTLTAWRAERERARRLARPPHRAHALRVILAGLLVALVAVACAATPSYAYTLGVGDRADADPHATVVLGATVYRVVIDPDVPLATYDARIAAHRAAGQEPQLVIGGTGTARHARREGLVAKAVEAFRRWPYAFSVSVVNEPDLSGMSACAYAHTYRAAYRALKRAGVRRVLFGEFSPGSPVRWTRAILARCGLKLRVDRFAWHAYDFSGLRFEGAIGNTAKLRAWLQAHRDKLGGHTPALYVTEYGVLVRAACQHCANPTIRGESEVAAMRKWRAALRVTRRYLAEIVAWDVHSPHAGAAWDSSLIEPSGRPRPAFGVIRAGVARARGRS